MPSQKTIKQKVTFVFNEPAAHTVSVAGDFTNWNQAPIHLKKDKAGQWRKTVSLPPGRYEYRLLVNGEWRDDPQCPNRRPNQFGSQNCICVVNGTPE